MGLRVTIERMSALRARDHTGVERAHSHALTLRYLCVSSTSFTHSQPKLDVPDRHYNATDTRNNRDQRLALKHFSSHHQPGRDCDAKAEIG